MQQEMTGQKWHAAAPKFHPEPADYYSSPEHLSITPLCLWNSSCFSLLENKARWSPALEYLWNLCWVIFCVSVLRLCGLNTRVVSDNAVCDVWKGGEKTATASFSKLSSHKWGIKASRRLRVHFCFQWQLSLLKTHIFSPILCHPLPAISPIFPLLSPFLGLSTLHCDCSFCSRDNHNEGVHWTVACTHRFSDLLSFNSALCITLMGNGLEQWN